MWIDTALSGISAAQYALQTIASVWQLTGHHYPPPVQVNNGDAFDYIVVGGGSAGAVVATRLSEDPGVSVLLIEAGPDPPIQSNLPSGANFLQNSVLDWGQEHQSQVEEEIYQCLRDKRQTISHGKVLGGGSSINVMLYMRGHPHDYDTWAEIAQDPSWKYCNVLEYFMKSERLTDEKILNSASRKVHGTDGPMGVSKLWNKVATKYVNIYKEMGYNYIEDLNYNATLGFSEQMVTVADGIRQSTANAHLASAAERKNLYVLRESRVTKIIIENKVATGVEYVDKNNKTMTVMARKEVVLSAGPINSPHLLLLSGVGPKEQLERFGIKVASDLPVGKQLFNHHGVFLIYKADKLEFHKGPQRPMDPGAYPFSITTGLLAVNRSQGYPDFFAATIATKSEELALSLCAIVFMFDKKTCQLLYDDTYGREVLFAAIAECRPSNSGRIGLRSADPLDSPDIYIKGYPDGKAYEDMLDIAQDFARIVNTTYFKSVGGELVTLPQCKQFDKSSREYLDCYGRCLSSAYYHHAGTCAMGQVVDSKLRVYGIKSLRVIDSSIMPTLTSGTTNAPSIMIGEKGSDMIKADN